VEVWKKRKKAREYNELRQEKETQEKGSHEDQSRDNGDKRIDRRDLIKEQGKFFCTERERHKEE
jgi:hypothetical protein